MKLTQSLEKYLLAIYEIVRTNKAARVRDVSNYLKIGGPATSDAVKTLAQRGFIDYKPYGIITITKMGKKKAEEKIFRHNTISNFLNKVLSVEKETADINAGKIEYSMTDDTLKRFVMFLNFMEKCSCKAPKWIKSWQNYVNTGDMPKNCKICIDNGKSACCKDFSQISGFGEKQTSRK